MAKKGEEVAVATKENEITEIEVSGKVLQVNDLLNKLKSAEEGDDLVKNYWTPEDGESLRAFFLGITTINKMNSESGETSSAVKLLLEDGRKVINADKVLVSALRDLEAPAPVSIDMIGWEKGKNGKYRQFRVNSLRLN